jgi:hypothetical protein
MTLEEKYNELCLLKSDINEHLPTLKIYADQCEHITEMGVRGIVSTYALLMGKPKKLISYDIINCDWLPIKELVAGITDFEFKLGNTLQIEIEPTDFLFIDTLHNYNQLKAELALHAKNVNKFIGFHDTTSYEFHGESYIGTLEFGIWAAIEEFLEENKNWEISSRHRNNNGLTVLRKK